MSAVATQGTDPLAPGAGDPRAGTPLARALEKLAALDPAGALGVGAVSRVEVETGEREPSLLLTVVSGVGERWFRAAGEEIVELFPDGDRALPLADARAGDPVLSYRPARRLVLLRARANAVEKGYRRARVEAAALRHALANRIAGTIPGLLLPRLLERRDATASLVLERLDGEPLRLEPGAVDRFALFGRALRAFQGVTVDPTTLPEHGVADELAVLDEHARRVEAALGAVDTSWRRGRELAASRATGLPAAPLALAHRDLHDGQLQRVGDAVALVDFDLLALADPALDAGNLLAHFELRRLQRLPGADEATVTAAERSFLAAFGRMDEPGFDARFAFFRGTSLLRLALVYRLRPRWCPLAPALVHEGMRWLESSGRP